MQKKSKTLTVIPFRKGPTWNIFDVYDEMPRAKQATTEMKAVCDKFLADHKRVAHKYQNEGLSDSASRDMILKYIIKRIY